MDLHATRSRELLKEVKPGLCRELKKTGIWKHIDGKKSGNRRPKGGADEQRDAGFRGGRNYKKADSSGVKDCRFVCFCEALLKRFVQSLSWYEIFVIISRGLLGSNPDAASNIT